MTARLHVLVLTLAAIGLLTAQSAMLYPHPVAVIIKFGAAAATLVGIAALSVLPQVLRLSMLVYGVLFALCTAVHAVINEGAPSQVFYLSCTTLGVLGYLGLGQRPGATTAFHQTKLLPTWNERNEAAKGTGAHSVYASVSPQPRGTQPGTL